MVVIGAGRIGRALGQGAVLIDRDRGWEALDADAGDPVVLAVRTHDLPAVARRVPPHRRPDLVVVQNGAVRDLLGSLGLERCTRGVLYVLVPGKGDPVVAARTSFFTGPHADAMARAFENRRLPAEAVAWPRFTVYEFEKLVWLAVNGLLCDRHGATVGEVATRHRDEHDALVRELAPVGRAAWGVDPDVDWLAGRLRGWSEAIAGYRSSVKELPWRNGWLRDEARRFGLRTPLHDRLLGG